LITDQWEGIGRFLKPDEEVLVARDGRDVRDILADLTDQHASAIGRRALQRVLREHTYQHRAVEVDRLFRSHSGRKEAAE
jgi:spore maturation protein CgeB